LVTHNPETIQSEAVDMRVLVADGGVTVNNLRRTLKNNRSTIMQKPVIATISRVETTIDDEGKSRSEALQSLTEDEERADGRVSKSVFAEYLKALGGTPLMILLAVVLLIAQAFQVASDFWLSVWTGSMTAIDGEQQQQQTSAQHNFWIYGLLGLATAIFFLARAMLIAFLGLRASRYLFDAMSASLLQAPLRFFDANPIGRVINRYSDDISQVDAELPFDFGGVVVSLVTTAFQLVTAIYVIQYAGVLFLPLAVLYFSVGNFYLAPSREIARLLKVAGSPVLSHVSESEEGVAVIRAFGPRFVQNAIEENFKRIDANNRAWYADALVNQWFAIRIQLVGCGVVILVVSATVWLKDVLSPGLVGLAFMYAVSNDEELLHLVRCWARLELSMVSPERIMEYIGIAPEGQDKIVTFDATDNTDWP
ncbi:Atp-binding protein, partial [Globisporangium polare]